MGLLTSRTRTWNTNSQQSYKRYWKKYNLTNVYGATKSGTVSTIKDNNNRPFRKGIPYILSDVDINRVTRIVTDGDVQNIEFRYTGDLSPIFPCSTPSGVHIAKSSSGRLESADYLLIKAYAKMNESNMLIGEMAHSLGQTVSMLRKPFKSASELVSRIAKSTKNRRARSSKQIAQAFSDSWLEYRYGWTPLMHDVNNIVDSYHQQLGKSKRRLVARSASVSSRTEDAAWQNVVSGDPQWTTGGSYTLSEQVSRNAGVVYDIAVMNARDDLAQQAGSRLSDLPSTIYEVIPYSFVVDWFVNVGDWIRAVTPVPGITPVGNWVTYTSMKSVNRTEVAVQYPKQTYQTYAYQGSKGGLHEETFRYYRECDVSLSRIPVLRVNGLSVLHQFDALGLMVNEITHSLKSLRRR